MKIEHLDDCSEINIQGKERALVWGNDGVTVVYPPNNTEMNLLDQALNGIAILMSSDPDFMMQMAHIYVVNTTPEDGGTVQ